MKYCHVCNEEDSVNKIIIRNFIYKGCEIPDVKIKKAEIWKCKKCGEIYLDGTITEKWHKEIAKELIRKRSPLSPNEFKFLRNTLLGLTLNDLEKLFGPDKSAISKWEAGVNQINPTSDRMLRILVEDFLKGREEYLQTLEKYAALIQRISPQPLKIAV